MFFSKPPLIPGDSNFSNVSSTGLNDLGSSIGSSLSLTGYATASGFMPGITAISANNGVTFLTSSSTQTQQINGTVGQTIVLPNATTLTRGSYYDFINDSLGTIYIVSTGGGAVTTIPTLCEARTYLLANGTSSGVWTSRLYGPFFDYCSITTVGSDANSAFQSINASVTANFTTISPAANILLFNNPSGGTTPVNISTSNIVIDTATGIILFLASGTFAINVSVSAEYGSRSFLQVVKNNTILAGLGLTTLADVQTITINTIVNITDGNTIDFRIDGLAGGAIYPITMSFNVMQI